MEKYRRYDFGTDGLVRIESWSTRRALDAYRHTLLAVPGRIEGETPAATMVSDAIVEWNAEPASIGMKVRQRHIGRVHPKVRPTIDKWVQVGKPYPSSGGFYYTVPNKSYERVVGLSEHPELRDSIIRLGIEDEWLRFWETYLPYRHDVSHHLWQSVLTGSDPEALSRHNERASTGIQIRGRRLERADLAGVARELEFLLRYSYAMGIAFAATQIAELPADQVWMITCYDYRIKGALASRSDMDVQDVGWDGERLTINGVAQTRQAGSDATGLLSNSHSERRLTGSSVTEYVIRKFKHPRVEYPFSNKDLLLQVWATDAKPFPGLPYVIGQDLGLDEPVKSGADGLFSRAFLKLGTKILPCMLSGSSWTQAVYSVFHNYFIEKAGPNDKFMAQGDDMNLWTLDAKPEIFDPYTKVKSTDAATNMKKILGLYTAMSIAPDPERKAEATIGIVPRVIKSLSSATKRGGAWGETLSDLSTSGNLHIVVPDVIAEAVREDIDVLLPYLMWSGKRMDLLPMLNARWRNIAPATWEVLMRHDPELQYRLTAREDVEAALRED